MRNNIISAETLIKQITMKIPSQNTPITFFAVIYMHLFHIHTFKTHIIHVQPI